MRELEARLGVRLDPDHPDVSATEAGERLITTLGPRLEEIEAELSAVVALGEKPSGTIRITAGDHVIRTLLWPRLKRFLRDYPDISCGARHRLRSDRQAALGPDHQHQLDRGGRRLQAHRGLRATKFAVEGLSLAVAHEVEPFGIRIVVVEPGFFRTDLLDARNARYGGSTIEDYATEGSAEAMWSGYSGAQQGDPAKLGEVLVKFAGMENPPLQFLAGSDALAGVMPVLEARLEELRAYEDLSKIHGRLLLIIMPKPKGDQDEDARCRRSRRTPREIRRKLRILEHAETSGDVSRTCRYYGLGRASGRRRSWGPPERKGPLKGAPGWRVGEKVSRLRTRTAIVRPNTKTPAARGSGPVHAISEVGSGRADHDDPALAGAQLP